MVVGEAGVVIIIAVEGEVQEILKLPIIRE